ncbi:hypothetical protein [Caldimonas sp.]|uniref:hypothetical protein n=1 Tax=Caldimonas sp. TaxID=2838790 RepID=UPI00391B1170
MIDRVLFSLVLAFPLMLGAAGVQAQQAPVLSDHVKKDIERHRAMAAAHEAAARCLESGKSEDACLKELQAACKGLGIGKHCGMRHVH